MQDFNHVSLSQLNAMIREAIEMNFLDEIWLVAEIAEMRIAGAGHCYLDLVEKRDNRIVARMRANIWKFQYDRIASRFFASTGSNLQKGMKVLFSVSISFHEQYGISLVVKNIDPSYSLGDLERKKKEIIQQLTKEGLVDKNSQLELEIVPKKIAVVSSETAAGYGDFMNQLNNNSGGYLFEVELFQSTMQGDGVEASIINNLKVVRKGDFDCVVIIRGGGASLDLAGFDNYNLGKAIAEFPIPVLTGIGHERDETIADIVSHTKLKTPTAVAEFLIEKMQNFEEYYLGLKEALVFFAREKVAQHKAFLQKCSFDVKSNTQKVLEQNRLLLTSISSELPFQIKTFLTKKRQGNIQALSTIFAAKNKLINDQRSQLMRYESVLKILPKQTLIRKESNLKLIEKTINLIHPDNVLKRGYALVMKEGKVLTESRKLSKGDEVEIKLRDGITKTKIIE